MYINDHLRLSGFGLEALVFALEAGQFGGLGAGFGRRLGPAFGFEGGRFTLGALLAPAREMRRIFAAEQRTEFAGWAGIRRLENPQPILGAPLGADGFGPNFQIRVSWPMTSVL